MKHLCILIFIIAVLLSSCGGHSARHQGDGDTVVFRYAQRLSVVRYKGYTIATLANPWKKGKILHQYLLVPKNGELPESLPHGCTIVRTPLQRSVVFTTVHCALLQMLHRESSIAGVADLKYIKIPFVHEAVDKGRIADVGDGMSPVVEKIIDLGPDALLLSPFENSGGYGRLEEIDIPIIECADYMDPTPLARAEWMRFYGLLFGAGDKADVLFHHVDSSYVALKQQAAQAGKGRSVIVDKVVGSVWYMPGGRSTIGQMLQDAGGQYPWATDDQSGSLSLPFETVLERGGEADVWMLRYSSDHDWDYKELLSGHRGYSQLKALRQHEVYGCNVEQSHFYEDTPFHPDRLLCDFLQILHPDIIGLPPLRYYKKLKE